MNHAITFRVYPQDGLPVELTNGKAIRDQAKAVVDLENVLRRIYGCRVTVTHQVEMTKGEQQALKELAQALKVKRNASNRRPPTLRHPTGFGT